MSIADGMQHIVSDIAESRNDRTARIASLNGEAAEIRSAARRTVRTFNSERRQNSAQMRRTLSKGRKTLARESDAMIGGFEEARMAMAQECRATLEDFTAGVRKDVTDIRIDATNLVRGFADDRVTCGIELTRMLKAHTDGVIQDVQQLMGECITQRMAVKADLDEAHAIWMGQAVVPASRTRTVQKPAEPTHTPEEESDTDLSEKVLRLIRKSPKGITLPEAGKKLGVEWRRLVRPAKELVRHGEVQKRDTQYFPG